MWRLSPPTRWWTSQTPLQQVCTEKWAVLCVPPAPLRYEHVVLQLGSSSRRSLSDAAHCTLVGRKATGIACTCAPVTTCW
mmetsp:Transcript_13734/g.32285  ORF Transcript_13734/g.32285 Transcript_13734/m.32285 type:complete len:80 (+) Transcript_13734:116-355(+)